MKYCPRCGAKNSVTTLACLKCFAQLDAAEPSARVVKEKPAANRRVATPKPPKPKAKKKSGGGSLLKIAIPVIIIAVLAVGGYFGYSHFSKPNLQKPVIDFCEALSEGKYAAAAELMTQESQRIFPIQNAASDPIAGQMVQFLPKISQPHAGEAVISENEATVQVSGVLESNAPIGNDMPGSTGPHTVYLRLEDGEWKIDMARFVLEWIKPLPKDTLSKARVYLAMGGSQTEGLMRLVDEAISSK